MRFCVTSAEATYAKQNMAESNTDDKALRMNVGGDKKSRHIKGVYSTRRWSQYALSQ